MRNLICYLFRQQNKTPYEIVIQLVGKQAPEIEPTNLGQLVEWSEKRRIGERVPLTDNFPGNLFVLEIYTSSFIREYYFAP